MSRSGDLLLRRRVGLVWIVDVDEFVTVTAVLDVIRDHDVAVAAVSKLDQGVIVVGEGALDVTDQRALASEEGVVGGLVEPPTQGLATQLLHVHEVDEVGDAARRVGGSGGIQHVPRVPYAQARLQRVVVIGLVTVKQPLAGHGEAEALPTLESGIGDSPEDEREWVRNRSIDLAVTERPARIDAKVGLVVTEHVGDIAEAVATHGALERVGVDEVEPVGVTVVVDGVGLRGCGGAGGRDRASVWNRVDLAGGGVAGHDRLQRGVVGSLRYRGNDERLLVAEGKLGPRTEPVSIDEDFGPALQRLRRLASNGMDVGNAGLDSGDRDLVRGLAQAAVGALDGDVRRWSTGVALTGDGEGGAGGVGATV